MSKRASFSAIETNQAIDAANGIIRGVSVATIGEADGHDLWLDSATLSKLIELAGTSVKVKMNHPAKGENAPVEGTAGMLTHFRLDGDQVRADLELLRSEDYFDKIIEMAQKMPRDFGLSIRVQFDTEKKDDKDYIRPTAIESVDLVDSPAANPNGLFSAKVADDKTKKTTSMSALIAKALGLADTASETEVVAELSKRLDMAKPADTTAITQQITEFSTKIKELDQKAKDAAEAARKTEVAALVAEASRDGKVVPLTDEEMASLSIPVIKTMISKLPKAQVSLSRRNAEPPKDKDGKRLRGEDLAEFCRTKREEGAAALSERFSKMDTLN